MRKQYKWLHGEIQAWLEEGLLNPQQADILRNRYILAQDDVAWGRTIFTTIGAILLGLGIILFFAYNWDEMHKYVKLATRDRFCIVYQPPTVIPASRLKDSSRLWPSNLSSQAFTVSGNID